MSRSNKLRNEKRRALKVATKEIIFNEAKALGISCSHGNFNLIASEVVASKGLKIKGQINRLSVAVALDEPRIRAIYQELKKLPRPKRTKERRKRTSGLFIPMAAPVVMGPTESDILSFYQGWEWKRVRYDFIKDKRQRCLCCGTGVSDGARIVVDHVKPIRKYWHLRYDPANLQILCDDCNMGKGSRDETDWRT